MSPEIAVFVLCGALAVGVGAAHGRAYRLARPGARLLAVSAVPLVLAGFIFAARFWHPVPGPYAVNRLYPFGNYLQTWAVSFGFASISFGLLYGSAALRLGARPDRTALLLLLATWLLWWLPHAIIGVGFLAAGSVPTAARAYRDWARAPLVRLLLAADSAIMLLHFVLALGGFLLWGRDVRRTPAPEPSSAGGRA